MKKFFIFAVALVASVSVNAQYITLRNASIFTADSTALAAKTVLGSNDAISVSTAFDDGYKTPVLKHEGFFDFQIDGAGLGIDTIGVQGQTNPVDVDGKKPADKCTVPTKGAVIQIDAKADGWIYVFHKASSNKQYTVYENDIALGYKFGMITTAANGYFGEKGAFFPIEYEVKGDNEYNQITDGRKIPFVEDFAKQETDTNIGKNNYKRNGLSVIAFPCVNNCKYYVCATGSKITATGVAYYAAEKDVYVLNEKANTTPIKIYTASEKSAIRNLNGEAKAQKIIRDGQIIIRKGDVEYTVLGTIAQ